MKRPIIRVTQYSSEPNHKNIHGPAGFLENEIAIFLDLKKYMRLIESKISYFMVPYIPTKILI